MGTANREIKLRLYAEDPHCHWCGRKTILTNIKEIKGNANPLMATVDHLISRYNPERWVRAKTNERRKVLACYECNQRRSKEETKKLHPIELRKRGQGYSLNPRRNPVVESGVASKEELFAKLQKRGIEILRFDDVPEYTNHSVDVLGNAINIP